MDRTHAFDPQVPSSARIYDYMLGGKDNYDIDRQVARAILAVAPDARILAEFTHQFMVKAVQLAAKARIRQFISLGAGYPRSPDVHEVIREIYPTATVVYIDNDPLALAHCAALLTHSTGVSAMRGDARQPQTIIERLTTDKTINFAKPVCLLLIGVLHYVMDGENPEWILTSFRDVMAPGSYLAFTHHTDQTDPALQNVTKSHTDNTPCQTEFRTHERITSFADDFELLGPGVVPVQEWLSPDLPETRSITLGGIGRRP
ncbi:SAM-dependent methyltransferase [Nocardia brasiliensis]|uniref:SAM-dependent methyltransferase n=1 Tax=Nocardia brasiliensis TaxID=37326 RepID=UPI003D8D007E